jgi:hypothetical protein
MSLHHPPLLSFDESLTSGARLYNRQQDALRRAADEHALDVKTVSEIVDAYLRRMTETEVRRGPRRTTNAVPVGQTTVDDQLAVGAGDSGA